MDEKDEAVKRGAEAGCALGMALRDVLPDHLHVIAIKAAIAALTIVLETTLASAHCYSVWRYPTPQHCASGRLYSHPVARLRGGRDFSETVAHARPVVLSRAFYVEVVKPPPQPVAARAPTNEEVARMTEDQQREVGLERLRRMIKAFNGAE